MKIKFRLRLNEHSFGKYQKGDEDDFYINVFDESNGLVRYPIHSRWDIVSFEIVEGDEGEMYLSKKEVMDFYLWMQKNEYDHNIPSRVEKKLNKYISEAKTQ